jgi:hypothetical protein
MRIALAIVLAGALFLGVSGTGLAAVSPGGTCDGVVDLNCVWEDDNGRLHPCTVWLGLPSPHCQVN